MFQKFVTLLVVASTVRTMDAAARTSRPFWMRRFECLEQPYKYTTVHRCQIESQRNSPQLVHVVVNITHLNTKLFITTDLYTKHRQSQTLMYGTTYEYCDFLVNDESRLNPVATLVYNYAKHNAPHIFKPCPIEGLFNVSNLRLDENVIPPFVTPGTYLGSQRFFNKRNETLLYYVAEFTVAASSIFNRTMTLLTMK